MTTEIKNDYDPHQAIDRLILRSLGEKLETQLGRAWHEIEYVHDELQALSAAEELPEAYREAYARLHDVASSALCAAKKAYKKDSRAWLDLLPPHVELELPSSEWIACAKQMVEQINALDLELEASLREARNVLLKGQPDAIFDWTMPVEVEVTLTMNHGPQRTIYDHIDQTYVGDSKYRIKVGCEYNPDGSCNDGEIENWNPLHDPDHPLSADTCHMTYLCHCIVDHLGFPWELLPCIDEIEATLRFSDYQTVWPVVNREVRAHRVIDG